MSNQILSFGMTDTGVRRAVNQDTYLLDDDLKLYVVADGMGGHAGGEVASVMAIEAVRKTLAQQGLTEPMEAQAEGHPLLTILVDAVRNASRAIFDRAKREPRLQGMGTTLTGVAFFGPHAFVAHVGDSRCYQIRAGVIEQLSEDHTLVREMVKNGLMTPEQATTSRLGHILSRSVGIEQEIAVDLVAVRTSPGDIFILCSDGLANVVPAAEIRQVVEDNFLRDVPRRLVELANVRGGPDNITVVILAVGPTPD